MCLSFRVVNMRVLIGAASPGGQFGHVLIVYRRAVTRMPSNLTERSLFDQRAIKTFIMK